MRQIAEEYQHIVAGETENGKEALALLPGVQSKMVLLDVSMPVMGGFATAHELRRIAPELPIVFVSQQADAEYVEEAFEVGACGYLLKSAISSELSPAIESVKSQQLYRSRQLAS